MAMPFVMGLMNVVVPLQIGARDVAFPVLNALSFWLFFVGAMLFNISFVIGGSPDAGWTSYFPMAGIEFSPNVSEITTMRLHSDCWSRYADDRY